MRLFIATTTLNFDSIMATESLSPSSFYEKREFGIKLFYNKGAFIRKNSILLFDRLPLYNFSESNVEHRPMVVEIDDCNYPEGTFEKVAVKNSLTIYRATNTLYISPLSCRIMFKCERDMNITIKKADNIIEAKYKAYKKLNAINIIPIGIGVPITGDTFDGIEDVGEINEKALKYDRMVDKAKGFAVSYMIGASRQLSPASVKMQRLYKDIKNTLYSLGTLKEPTMDELSTINKLVIEAEKLSYSLDQKKQQAERRLCEFLKSAHPENMLHGSNEVEVLTYIKSLGQGIYEHLLHKINGPIVSFSIEFCVHQAINAKDDDTLEKAIDNLREYVMSISKTESGEKHLSNIMSFGIDLNVIDSLDKSLTSESQKELGILYNLYTGAQYSSYSINTTRNQYVYDAAVALGIPKSDDQSKKDYFNALLDNLEHMTKFDIKRTSDPIMMSLAAFMKAPDVDINKLTSLLVNNEISDVRVAYGLWGLFHGYSNVRQDLFNELLANYKDEPSLISFVKDLYVAIHKNEPLFSHVEETEHKLVPDIQKIDAGIERAYITSSSSSDNEMPINYRYEYTYLATDLEKIILENAPKKNAEIYNNYYIPKVSFCCQSNHIVAILNGIDNIPVFDIGRTCWKETKGKLKKLLKTIERKENTLSLFGDENENRLKRQSIINSKVPRFFYNDSEAWVIVSDLIPAGVAKQIKDDILWFQEQCKGDGRYSKIPKDNSSMLKTFEAYLKKRKNPDSNSKIIWVAKFYKNVDITKVISRLQQVYE